MEIFTEVIHAFIPDTTFGCAIEWITSISALSSFTSVNLLSIIIESEKMCAHILLNRWFLWWVIELAFFLIFASGSAFDT